MNILITSVSAKVLLIQAFRKALDKENMDGEIFGIDISPHSAALAFCDKQFNCPRIDDQNFTNFINQLCKDQLIDLIIPTRDEDVQFFAQHRDEFNREVEIMVARKDTIDTCYDKLKFSKFLKNHDLPHIKTWSEIPTDIQFPCIVKPRKGAGSIGFQIVKTESQLKKILANNSNLIIQEFVAGIEHSIDYFADFSGNKISAVPRIRLKIVSGESKVGKTVNNNEIIEQTGKLGEKLKLIGHNVIQCFLLDDGRIKFIEVNPRFGGASNLSFESGRPTPQYLIRLMQNKRLNIKPFKDNLVMLRYSQDTFIQDD